MHSLSLIIRSSPSTAGPARSVSLPSCAMLPLSTSPALRAAPSPRPLQRKLPGPAPESLRAAEAALTPAVPHHRDTPPASMSERAPAICYAGPCRFLQLPLVHPHPRLVRTGSATSCPRTAAYPEPQRGAYNPPKLSPGPTLSRVTAAKLGRTEDQGEVLCQAAIPRGAVRSERLPHCYCEAGNSLRHGEFTFVNKMATDCVVELIFPNRMSIVKLYRSTTPFNESEDAETRITEAAFQFFENISAEPSDDNPETVKIYIILREAGGRSPECKDVLEEFAAEWPKACKSDAMKRKTFKSLAAKQVKESAKMNDREHGVDIFLREKLWAEERQRIYILKYNPGVDLDCILWRINSWWIRDYSGLPVITRNPHFHTTRSIGKESWFESTAEWSVGPLPFHQIVESNDQFVMYIDKLSCLWLTDTNQRFGNICRLGERGSYLVKDAHGVLHNSVGLGRPFEGRELYVVRREGGQDKPPVRNTWKQLLDEWDATDSKTGFRSTTTGWDVSKIHRQQ
ncbi:hypothetical protein DFH09DRAFT_1104633 [Mycena vulgaris]|nr:hypothetical protein DFH09DRAFT_1104633 [Mycena vulgaris]